MIKITTYSQKLDDPTMETAKVMPEQLKNLLGTLDCLITTKGCCTKAELKVLTPKLDMAKNDLRALEFRDRYFFTGLSKDTAFENCKEFGVFTAVLPEQAILYKRMFIFINTLREFLKKNDIAKSYWLSASILLKIFKCYINDLDALKKTQRNAVVQLPEIAGIMTNLIVKYHPIVPIHDEASNAIYINEMFAIYHALCICSEFSNGIELLNFELQDTCDGFKKDMKSLLSTNFTLDSLIMVFKVLCIYQFPDALNKNYSYEEDYE